MDKSLTIPALQGMKARGEKIAMLTAYDASFAATMDEAGIDVILVGDSLGMVVQGHASTLPVTLDHMAYHAACVARGARRAMVVADLPFMSYPDAVRALDSAARLVRETGVQMVKLEGGRKREDVIRALVDQDIPVCAHLGLLPQSVHRMGGYLVQGRDEHSAQTILEDAILLQEAGASLLVLECVPAPLAGEITAALKIPTIGIGAGPDCDGQVLVCHDMLGITPGKRPKFSKNFLEGTGNIREAFRRYALEVREGHFPGPEHSF
ncbi:3-methyl-2-oxobutanoate hydroxymethyltransferase [Methylomagnum sp.]